MCIHCEYFSRKEDVDWKENPQNTKRFEFVDSEHILRVINKKVIPAHTLLTPLGSHCLKTVPQEGI
jgi:hypothetical protein